MSKRDARLFIEDMLESIAKIERYTAGLSYEQIVSDERTIDAVVRNLEIIGEAARQIPETLRKRYTDVPWRRVIGFRNIVVHRYFAVDVGIVWTIVRENLPELKASLQKLLSDLDSK
ncbi:MAG: DUF86 domain-containing protein [Calditrichaeota bacterium]|nr:MAG: DUF86 domain-containing protein [Calditrichota bacterium]